MIRKSFTTITGMSALSSASGQRQTARFAGFRLYTPETSPSARHDQTQPPARIINKLPPLMRDETRRPRKSAEHTLGLNPFLAARTAAARPCLVLLDGWRSQRLIGRGEASPLRWSVTSVGCCSLLAALRTPILASARSHHGQAFLQFCLPWASLALTTLGTSMLLYEASLSSTQGTGR